MLCIESSLLKSVYITLLYVYIEEGLGCMELDSEEMRQLSGYFILTMKQYLRDMQSVNQTMKRSELLNNLQSSLKCGLCVGHYL